MEYSKNNRRGNTRKHWNNSGTSKRNNENRHNDFYEPNRRSIFRPSMQLPQSVQEEMEKDEQTVQKLKQKRPICSMCGKTITEISTALADKKTGEPLHFDCVLDLISKSETLKENEKITYIGQGRFAVVLIPNSDEPRNFTIQKIIEWEPKDKTYEWRSEFSAAYSQVH